MQPGSSISALNWSVADITAAWHQPHSAPSCGADSGSLPPCHVASPLLCPASAQSPGPGSLSLSLMAMPPTSACHLGLTVPCSQTHLCTLAFRRPEPVGCHLPTCTPAMGLGSAHRTDSLHTPSPASLRKGSLLLPLQRSAQPGGSLGTVASVRDPVSGEIISNGKGDSRRSLADTSFSFIKRGGI